MGRGKIEVPDHLSDESRKAIETKLSLYDAAEAGNVDAIIYFLRAVAKWKD